MDLGACEADGEVERQTPELCCRPGAVLATTAPSWRTRCACCEVATISAGCTHAVAPGRSVLTTTLAASTRSIPNSEAACRSGPTVVTWVPGASQLWSMTGLGLSVASTTMSRSRVASHSGGELTTDAELIVDSVGTAFRVAWVRGVHPRLLEGPHRGERPDLPLSLAAATRERRPGGNWSCEPIRRHATECAGAHLSQCVPQSDAEDITGGP